MSMPVKCITEDANQQLAETTHVMGNQNIKFIRSETASKRLVETLLYHQDLEN
jgi:hypothetical protein